MKLKSGIHNDYANGDGRYPKTWKKTLHLLTQYTQPTIPRNSESQGNAFSQKTGDGRSPQTYDKAYCNYKECYNCHKKGHPYSHCQNKKKKKDNNDDNYKSGKESSGYSM